MLQKWLVFLFWRPFELFCHWNPLIRIRLKVEDVSEGIQIVYLNNIVTKLLSKTSGGYNYAVLFIVDRELIFDTGYAWARKVLCHYLCTEQLTQSIRSIVNSHYHEDHCGNNQRILKLCPTAKAYAHPIDAPQMMYPSAFPWYRRFLFGPVEPHLVNLLPKEFTLSTGRVLTVIETPGHTPGHICLYDSQTKVLFAGDLFIDISVDSQLSEVDGSAWIESLQTILELDIEFLLDGHGVVLQGKEVSRNLTQKLEFLQLLRSTVTKIVAQSKPKTLNAMVHEVFAAASIVNLLSMNEGWMSVITAGDFSRSHLIRGFVDEAVQEQYNPQV